MVVKRVERGNYQLKGGAKHNWIQDNKVVIWEYVRRYGASTAMKEYSLDPLTLERVLVEIRAELMVNGMLPSIDGTELAIKLVQTFLLAIAEERAANKRNTAELERLRAYTNFLREPTQKALEESIYELLSCAGINK